MRLFKARVDALRSSVGVSGLILLIDFAVGSESVKVISHRAFDLAQMTLKYGRTSRLYSVTLPHQ
jgi:hypothetical protein